jgi:DNA-binding MarR family transcriptional regulator
LVTKSGIGVSPQAGWLLLRVGEHAGAPRAELASRLRISLSDLSERMSELVQAGYIEPDGVGAPEQPEQLTEAGRAAHDRIFAARQDRIAVLLEGWQPQHHPKLLSLLGTITHELAASHERPGPDLDAAATAGGRDHA